MGIYCGYGKSAHFGGYFFAIMGRKPYNELLSVSVLEYGTLFSVHGGPRSWWASFKVCFPCSIDRRVVRFACGRRHLR